MKNRLGWILATLAIITFSFGQAGAAASQIVTATKASVAVPQVAPAAVAPAAAPSAVMNAPTNPTDKTKVPHYFGPYPNWANSPQVLSNAVVTVSKGIPTPVSIGNPLVDRAYATDFATAPGVLGPVFVVLASDKLPAGTLESFQVWNQGVAAGSPTTSAGNLFHAYVLRPTSGVANKYTVIHDSGELTMPAPAVAGISEVATFSVAPAVTVAANDVIGFYGEGIPVDTGITVNPDAISTPASTDATLATNVAPVMGGTMTLGVDPGFPLLATQDRTYSFAATMTPSNPGTGATATATVEPKTGGIGGIIVTDPGTGYTTPPNVVITAPGVTPTSPATATAVISTGVVTSIAVAEAGFGFTTPSVAITGGGVITTPATAQAGGGVDDLTITAGGSGYLIEPIVKFGLPDLPGGVLATGTATMDATGAVNGVAVTTPGSGYTTAPTVDIWDGAAPNLATPAIVTATIGVGQIDMLVGGAGYDSVPTVTITEAIGGADKGASATATVAALGAVTAITVTAPGAGYLTPGLKKFVNTLSGLGPTAANNLGNYIPVAVPDTTTYPGTDYYEIGLVQYRHKFHTDIPATLVRGYVQLSTSVVPGGQLPLTNANLDPALPAAAAMLPAVGTAAPLQALGVDTPHYLGPTIVATKDRPTRITFRNLLPTGVAGDLFLPVDTSLMGSGPGPDMMTLGANGVPNDMAMDEGTVLDGVRNPACGETPKPRECYSESRATLHLHGGVTPWISDGTPHQWITPAGEDTAYPKGVSVSNVPDMVDPGPGAETFFYTNQQSARLMFYHDHAWGITRLNVYAGEAAPYLVTDPMEQTLIAAGGALAGLGLGTPLVVQDKTFVPSDAAMAQQDPTWNAAKWGGEGSLWAPHVYMPAQNPGDPSGMSSFGRWMYGPWFWPPAKDVKHPPIANPYFDAACDPNVQPFCEPALIPSTPNVSVGMEAFNDTPIVNGTAYPTTAVDPKAYRYRVLNAANDRFWNLSWYVADPTTGTLSEVALNPAEVAAAQTDLNIVPTPDTTKSPKGPNWIQIGTEGGFLPAPVVVPAQPTTWITDPTRFDVGNVDLHSLLLAPAERADVIVDFSQYRGKTLILYNDAPAAFPARVPGYDYFTGGPDLAPSGAPTTLPGYGPNTRTIMQVKVSTAAPAVAFDRPNTTADRMGALNTVFAHKADGTGVFESSQDPVIVGQAAYNSAYGSSFAAAGWCNSPVNPSPTCDGYARIAEQGGFPFKFDTLGTSPTTTVGPKVSVKIEPKGIHDEMNSANFDEWGRMTANMGLEAPGATPLLQNIILYPYVNPATELLDSTNMPSALDVTPISTGADGTQIWKITHNGVDTHPLHFHLYNVQVINRVTWDNIIIPPEATELGWKETVRVSPLEDTIVALRPIVPTLPFGVSDSTRAMNPSMPLGAKGSQNGPNGTEAGFNNTNALGNPIAPIINAVVNMDWEYVWHCHILSHEEMDMMRPVTVKVPHALPAAPVLTNPSGSVLNWTDGTPVDYLNPVSWANPGTAEVGYRIQRAPVLANGTPGVFADIGNAVANQTTFTDPAGAGAYRVVAWNAAGDSLSNAVNVLTAPAAPTSVAGTSGPALGQVALTWSAPASNGGSAITGYSIERSSSTGTPAWTSVANVGVVTSYTVSALTPGASYLFRVMATNAIGNGPWSAPSAAARATTTPGAPTGLTGGSATATSIALSWTPPADNGGAPLIRYLVRYSTNNGVSYQAYVYPPVTNPLGTTYTWTGLTPGTSYRFQVIAQNSAGWGTWSAASPAVSTTSITAPSAPLSVVGTRGNAKVALTWQAPASTGGSPITGYGVDYSSDGGTTWSTAIAPSAALTARSYTVTGLTNGTAYVFRVVAANVIGSGPWSATSAAYTPAVSAPSAPTILSATPGAGQVALSWTPPADNGGAPVTRYLVRYSTNNGASYQAYAYPPVTNPLATDWAWTGLTPGTTYRFQVIAQNLVGWGAWSAISGPALVQ